MTALSEYMDCPKCGKAVRIDAAMCGFCWTKFRDVATEATDAAPPPLFIPPNGPIKESAPRSKAVMRRYTDAYRVANVLVSTGETIKLVGYGLAAFLGFIGLLASSEAGFLALLVSIPAAILIGLVAWLSGVLLSATGQLLQASLDGALNSSPFLNEEEKAEVMSLPEDGELR